MTDRYLLYIDILGFSDLVTEQIHDLYEVIASLNIHKHSAFRALVFSDTILVYSVDGGHTPQDRSYLVMFLCEVAQDLQLRLTGRGIVFRAVLVRGDFTHYELNSLPCFFGPALNDAHRSEKEIKAVGLFMQRSIVPDSDIFKGVAFNDKYNFVFITQSLNEVEDQLGGSFPMARFLVEDTELIYYLVPEILYLKQLNHWATAHRVKKVRKKCLRSLALFRTRYPKTLQHLESTNFDLEAISPGASWAEVVSRFPENYAGAIENRVSY